jgi:hypothetical protein
MKDKEGRVFASVIGLADRSKVTLEECQLALNRLSSPDPHSRSPEFEGRRIEAIDGGWSVLNHFKYRDADRTDYWRSRYEKQKLHGSTISTVEKCATGEIVESTGSTTSDHNQINDRESKAVELPPHFPKTVVEAAATCGALAVPASFVETTWHKAASRGGHDAKDVPIRSWQSYVASEWAFERNRIAQNEQKAKAQPANVGMTATEKILRAKELDRVEARMKAIHQSYDSHQSWTVEDKGEYRKLKERREILKKMLGLTV